KLADRGHLGNAGVCFELVAQIPVLEAAQVSEAALLAMDHQDVLVDPTRSGCVRSDDRMNARWQPTCNSLHVLQDPRPRPVDVCTVLKDNEDGGVAKQGQSTHRLD